MEPGAQARRSGQPDGFVVAQGRIGINRDRMGARGPRCLKWRAIADKIEAEFAGVAAADVDDMQPADDARAYKLRRIQFGNPAGGGGAATVLPWWSVVMPMAVARENVVSSAPPRGGVRRTVERENAIGITEPTA
jgi:hypothetical protein